MTSLVPAVDVLRAVAALFAAVYIMLLCGNRILAGSNGNAGLRNAQDAFWSLLLGTVLFTALYAIIVTKLHSILLIVPPLCYFWIRELRRAEYRTPQLPGGNNSTRILLLTGGLGLVAVIAFGFVILHKDGAYSYYGDDQMYYANLASFLNIHGKEAGNIDFINPETTIASPYHYGDIWTIAMFARAAGVSSALALVLCVYPLFLLIACLGVLAVLEQAGGFDIRKKPAAALLAPIMMFAAGYTFLFPYFLFPWDRRNNAVYNMPKYIVPGIIYLSMLLSYLYRNTRLLLLVTAVGAAFYLSLSITFGLTAGVIILASVARVKGMKRADGIFGLAIWAALGFWLLLYYGLAAKGQKQFFTDHYSLFNIADLKRSVAGTIFSSVLQSSYYLLHGVAGILFLRQHYRGTAVGAREYLGKALCLPVLLFCAGTLGSIVTYNVHMDYWQLFSTIFIPVADCGIALLYLLVLFNGRTTSIKLVVVIMLCINVYEALITSFGFRFKSEHTVDIAEFDRVTTFVGSDARPRFGYYQVVAPNAPYTYSSMLQSPCAWMSYVHDPYICLSVNSIYLPEYPPLTERDIRLRHTLINGTDMARWYLAKPAVDITDTAGTTADFVIEKRLSFLFYPADTPLPPRLRELVRDSIRIESENKLLYHLEFPAHSPTRMDE